jgi:hypothetical protein
VHDQLPRSRRDNTVICPLQGGTGSLYGPRNLGPLKMASYAVCATAIQIVLKCFVPI